MQAIKNLPIQSLTVQLKFSHYLSIDNLLVLTTFVLAENRMTNMVTRTALNLKLATMQETFLDALDLSKEQSVEDRLVPRVEHTLRASSMQNLPHDLAIDKAQFQQKIMNIELKNRIYDLSKPNGLIERTFPDSVVPLDLVELLDARILQFPKLIDGLAVVKTWIFYKMLIQAFFAGNHRLRQGKLHSKPISGHHLWVMKTKWPSG
jgi:hypothetical protein